METLGSRLTDSGTEISVFVWDDVNECMNIIIAKSNYDSMTCEKKNYQKM